MIALILAMAVFAFVAIFPARRMDQQEAHLQHTPESRCIECQIF